MSEKDLSPENPVFIKVLKNPKDIETVRGRYWEVRRVKPYDLPQWKRTARALTMAGMSWVELHKAGKFLGNDVESGEIDAPIQKGWGNETGEIVEDEHRISGWQYIGEKVPVDKQLQSGPGTGTEIIEISDYLPQTQTTDQIINVLEGINIMSDKPQSLPNIHGQERENNPFLKPIQDLKKAA